MNGVARISAKPTALARQFQNAITPKKISPLRFRKN